MKLLWNGQLIDSKEAVISALDHGFLYGMGLFETFRTYHGRPWLLERHAARLQEGCELLGISYVADTAGMQAVIKRLLQANGLEDGYIRWSVSAGEGAVGLPPASYETPNEILYAKALAADEPDTRKGKTLRLLRLPRSTPELSTRLKSFHYMNNIVAKRELIASGADLDTEGLFLDAKGHIAEGIVSNVFWVKDGVLYTPGMEAGMLPGITRAYLLEIARNMGISIQQGLYGWHELFHADEVLLTNSIQEIVPVIRLEDGMGQIRQLPEGISEGSLTYKLMKKYRAAAERTDV